MTASNAIMVTPAPPTGLYVDLNSNEAVRVRKQSASLPADEAEVLSALLHHRQGASIDQIHHALYGQWSGAPDVDSFLFRSGLHQIIIRLRRYLEPLRAVIHSRDSNGVIEGYRLEVLSS